MKLRYGLGNLPGEVMLEIFEYLERANVLLYYLHCEVCSLG